MDPLGQTFRLITDYNTINRRLISFFYKKKQIIVRIINNTDNSEFSNMTEDRRLINHIRGRTILQMSLFKPVQTSK